MVRGCDWQHCVRLCAGVPNIGEGRPILRRWPGELLPLLITSATTSVWAVVRMPLRGRGMGGATYDFFFSTHLKIHI